MSIYPLHPSVEQRIPAIESILVPHFTLFFALRASQTRHGKARRAGSHSIAKRCNAALARLGAPFGRDEKRPTAVLRELERGLAIPALARLAAGHLSPR